MRLLACCQTDGSAMLRARFSSAVPIRIVISLLGIRLEVAQGSAGESDSDREIPPTGVSEDKPAFGRFLKIEQAAAELDVSESEMWSVLGSGDLKGIQIGGRGYLAHRLWKPRRFSKPRPTNGPQRPQRPQ